MDAKMSLDDILAIERTLKEHEAANMRIVRIKLSNLPVFVISSDLQNLFGNFNLETATVNFNEKGESLRSGDIFLPKNEAIRAMEDFKGFSLLGKELRMVLAKETTQIKRTSRRDLSRCKSIPPNLNKVSRKEDFRQKLIHKQRNYEKGRVSSTQPKRTIEQLDAELDAYFAGKSGASLTTTKSQKKEENWTKLALETIEEMDELVAFMARSSV